MDAVPALATDPVCGMAVNPAKAAGHMDHSGKTYFFCSVHCLGNFKADPARYAHEGWGTPARVACQASPIRPGRPPAQGVFMERQRTPVITVILSTTQA